MLFRLALVQIVALGAVLAATGNLALVKAPEALSAMPVPMIMFLAFGVTLVVIITSPGRSQRL
jgi:hypothetical protein